MSEYQPAAPAALAVQETNFVTASTAKKRLSDVDPRIIARVAEFATAYPELARRPVSETHGRKLRREVTDPEFVDRWVEPESEFENPFKVVEEKSRPAVTWLHVVHRFLTAHSNYDGLVARFENTDETKDEDFLVDLNDAWGPEYMDKEYARAKALDRQTAGGQRPTGGEAHQEWDRPATSMLTLTASSIPASIRLLGVDHLDAVHDSWSKNGVRQTLRNTMEHHLGLDAADWGYWAQAEPHGAGASADPDKNPGLNACYTHVHVAVYFDAAPLFGDLDGDPEAVGTPTHQRWESIGSEFERVIDKHVDVCEPAGKSGHNYEKIDSYVAEDNGCISLNPEVENLGSYLAAYLGGYKGDLFDRSIEYIAWGSLYWSTARQRTTRSQRINHAIRADACQQRAESDYSEQSVDHGERVRWNHGHGPDVVCSCCGSGWQVDQERLDQPIPSEEIPEPEQPDGPQASGSDSGVRADGGLVEDDDGQPAEGELAEEDGPDRSDHGDPQPPQSLAERWPTADGAHRIGESTEKARVRTIVEDHLRRQPGDVEDVSVPRLLGELSIAPRFADFVADLLDGTADDDLEESFSRSSGIAIDEWELVAIIDKDGEEHTPGDGGIDMRPLNLPTKNIVENTRLRHDREKGEYWYDRKTSIAFPGGCDAETVAAHYVKEGITDPQVVDSLLGISDWSDLDRDCMQHPDGLERFGKA